jgi:hypothetical protein
MSGCRRTRVQRPSSRSGLCSTIKIPQLASSSSNSAGSGRGWPSKWNSQRGQGADRACGS